MAKQVLGKGLAALIPQKKAEQQVTGVVTQESPESALKEIALSEIKKNQYQPRIDFDEAQLQDLIASVKEKGILQPVIVRPSPDGTYELIAGERRFRAAKEVGLKTIPALVKQVSKGESLELALIENLQRENLNPIEEAKAYVKLSEEFSLTQDDIAQKIGKTRTVITNCIRLLKLPQEIQDMLTKGELSTGHARAILSVEDKARQLDLSRRVIKDNLSVRQIESLVQKMAVKKSNKKKTEVEIDPQLASIKEDIQRVIGTKVSIKPKGTQGKIEIDYYSVDDLTRIWELFKIDNY